MSDLGNLVLRHKQVMDALLSIRPEIERARDMVLGCPGTVYWAGNGGSAAMASHLACELVGRGRSSVSLTADPAILTALANDFSFERVFSLQLNGIRGTDILVLLSTSGDSPSVKDAALVARGGGLCPTIGLSGENGALMEIVHHAVCVPSTDTQLIQEAHLFIGHYITGMSA